MADAYDYEQWETDGENSLWFTRFCYWRDLGPARTMVGAARIDDMARHRDRTRRSVPTEWYKQAALFCWAERAATYDTHRRKEAASRKAKIDGVADRVIDKLVEQAEALISNPDASLEETLDTYLHLIRGMASEKNSPKRRNVVVTIGGRNTN